MEQLSLSLELSPKLQRELETLVAELERAYERHASILKHGTTDPFWHDGVNLGLVRSHIIYFREEVARLCDRYLLPLPEVARRPVPQEYPRDWCLRCRQGRCPVARREEVVSRGRQQEAVRGR